MGELLRIMFEPFTKLKRFLPIKIHHKYYSYGWWIGDKFIFFEKHWIPFIIVPSYSEYHICVFAKNGKRIEARYTHSWDRYYEQFNKDEIRPRYYELVNIKYKKKDSNEFKIDKAWLAVDDYDRFVWTLDKSNLIIFDDEVIDWWR